MIIFQDKSYLQAVLVAVCIPLLCDNAVQYSESRAAILVVVVVVVVVEVVVDFGRSEIKIEKMVSEIKEENEHLPEI
jgi:predicted ABC-type exoprotein transport system permease subunit